MRYQLWSIINIDIIAGTFPQTTHDCWIHVHAAQKRRKGRKPKLFKDSRCLLDSLLRVLVSHNSSGADSRPTPCWWSQTHSLSHDGLRQLFRPWASQNLSPVESPLGDNGLARLKQTDSTHTHIWSHLIKSLSKSYKCPKLLFICLFVYLYLFIYVYSDSNL